MLQLHSKCIRRTLASSQEKRYIEANNFEILFIKTKIKITDASNLLRNLHFQNRFLREDSFLQ